MIQKLIYLRMSVFMNDFSNVKIEFLKTALDYAEKRINAMDQKASILMAITGGLYLLFVSIAKDIIGGIDQLLKYKNLVSYASLFFISVSLLIMVSVIFHLIQTIRPEKGLLKYFIRSLVPRSEHKRKSRININTHRNDENYIMWFKEGFNIKKENYTKIVESLNYQDIILNLEKAHLSSLQLLEKKYYYYRPAVSGIILSLIWNTISILLFLVNKSFF
jgi:hypothetical protein